MTMPPPRLLTVSGNYFNLLEPEKNIFSIHDIAHGLSHTCRFAGQTRRFYSVAQHSVLVSYIVPRQYAVLGLLHDAAEAFIGDIPRPLKELLPDYRAIEKRVERTIFARFSLPEVMPVEIKRADRIALATELRDLMPPHDEKWSGLSDVEPMSNVIVPEQPEKAKILFLDRWHELEPVGTPKGQ